MRNIFLVICLFSSLVFAEFDYAAYKKGNEAFKNADYKEAMKIWKSVIPTMRSKNRYPHNGIIDEYTMCISGMSCDINNPDAQADLDYKIGYLYSKGWGTVKNYVKALNHLERARALNHPQAQLYSAVFALQLIDEGFLSSDPNFSKSKALSEIAGFVSKTIENEHSPDELVKEAENIWNKEKLWKYPHK